MDNNPKGMTIEQQALALVNEVRVEVGAGPMVPRNINPSVFMALCRELERHEAFRQEVSEAIKERFNGTFEMPTTLSRFIIEPPVDPLVEALSHIGHGTLVTSSGRIDVDALIAALAKHGLQITGVET